MKIKMLKTTKGAEDGIAVKEYIQEQQYDITEKLAKIFVDVLKVAEFVQEKELVVKEAGPAPENKMAKEDKKDKKENKE